MINMQLMNQHCTILNGGAEIMGVSTAQCCFAYMTKHLVSLSDIIDNPQNYDQATLEEKIQDCLNYVRFLYAILRRCEA